MTKTKSKKRTAAKPGRSQRVYDSSGNVFADIGLPDAGARLVKARLAYTICNLLRAADLTQKEAAELLGIDQPKISALMRGKLKDFSTERLMRFVTALDHDVVITITEPIKSGHPSLRVRIEAQRFG
jgi:predicted XRE-type DNA-binding protein